MSWQEEQTGQMDKHLLILLTFVDPSQWTDPLLQSAVLLALGLLGSRISVHAALIWCKAFFLLKKKKYPISSIQI